MSCTLLLIEPHSVVRTGLATRLELIPGITLVGTTGHMAEAVALARTHRPDSILMEPKQLDALPLVQKLRTVSPQSRLLVYTTYIDFHEMAVLSPFISAYLLKSFDLSELQSHLTLFLRGEVNV